MTPPKGNLVRSSGMDFDANAVACAVFVVAEAAAGVVMVASEAGVGCKAGVVTLAS